MGPSSAGRLLKTVLAGLISVLVLPSAAIAQNPVQRLTSYFEQLAEAREFSGNVAVAERGRILFERSFGYADFTTRHRNSRDVSFPIASISKTLTATGILQLVERGVLQLSDPVTKYLPEWPYSGITLRHLLSHTSGLPPYNAYFDSLHALDSARVFTNADFLPAVRATPKPLLYQPGERGNYDNINYIVLALILERASGSSYPEYIATHILTPAGMNNTRFIPFAEQLSDSARKNFSFPQLYPHLYSQMPVPALSIPYVVQYWRAYRFSGFGDYVSTTRDLIKYAAALSGGRLLAESTLAVAYTPMRLNDGAENPDRFGMGWELEKDTTLGRVAYHSGFGVGLSAVLLMNLSKHQTVVLFDNAHSNAHEVGTNALSILNGRDAPAPKKSWALMLGRKLAAEGRLSTGRVIQELMADTTGYSVDEEELNALGYDFMGAPSPYHLPITRNYEDALQVFKINTELFPESWNVYDSYGEALRATGRREDAIRTYQKSLELKPDSQNGLRMLKKLQNEVR